MNPVAIESYLRPVLLQWGVINTGLRPHVGSLTDGKACMALLTTVAAEPLLRRVLPEELRERAAPA